MEKNNEFRFCYSGVTVALLYAVIFIALAGTGLNVYNFIAVLGAESAKAAVYMIFAAITVAVFVLSVSVLVCGKYVVGEKYLYVVFGLIRLKTDIKDITDAAIFEKSGKCVIYFRNGKYTVIVTDRENYRPFINALIEKNGEIAFDANAAEKEN